MPYITSIERMARQEGREEGRKEEAEAGRQRQVLTLTKLLERQFGQLPATLSHRISQADVETLLVWFDQALSADNLQAVFANGHHA